MSETLSKAFTINYITLLNKLISMESLINAKYHVH